MTEYNSTQNSCYITKWGIIWNHCGCAYLHKCKAENKVFVVQRGLEVEDVSPGHPLPPGSAGGLDHWGKTFGKEGMGLAQVDHIEDNALIFLCVFNGEVKPESGINVIESWGSTSRTF